MSTRPGPTDFQGWIRDAERRMGAQERRPGPAAAALLMGPGLGPTAVEVSDWNSEAFDYTGFYFSQPGAINSPDPTKSWMGVSLADTNGIGYQRITVYRDPASEGTTTLWPSWPGPTYTRAFYSQDGSSRSYSTWILEGSRQNWFQNGIGSDQVITGTGFTDVTTLSVAVPVADPAQVFSVHAMLDVAHGDTGNQTFIGKLVADGVDYLPTLRFNAQAINNLRTMLTGHWIVDGMSVGLRVIKMQAALSATGNFNINIANCSISAELGS